MDDQVSRTMPHVVKGKRIFAREFNDVADAVNRLTQGVTGPQQIVIPKVASAGGAGALFARLCTVANHALEGLDDIDGETPEAGDPIFVPWQTDATENAIYSASENAWTLEQAFDEDVLYQPVFIAQGNVFGQSHFFITADDTAVWQRIRYRARFATTANMASISGTSASDGITPAAGDLALVWKQSTASQNGLYLVTASGDWVKVASFALADIGLQCSVALGTLYGLFDFVVTAANTVKVMGAELVP